MLRVATQTEAAMPRDGRISSQKLLKGTLKRTSASKVVYRLRSKASRVIRSFTTDSANSCQFTVTKSTSTWGILEKGMSIGPSTSAVRRATNKSVSSLGFRKANIDANPAEGKMIPSVFSRDKSRKNTPASSDWKVRVSDSILRFCKVTRSTSSVTTERYS